LILDKSLAEIITASFFWFAWAFPLIVLSSSMLITLVAVAESAFFPPNSVSSTYEFLPTPLLLLALDPICD
jgi:hypothetical protein